MKKLIALNLVLIVLIVGVLLFPNPETTGFVVKEGVVEGYMLSLDMKDVDTELSSAPVRAVRVYFADSLVGSTDSLVRVGNREFWYDADGDGGMCENRSYNLEEWAYDANGNEVGEGSEPRVYSVVTDEDGCLGVVLPSEDFRPFAKEALD